MLFYLSICKVDYLEIAMFIKLDNPLSKRNRNHALLYLYNSGVFFPGGTYNFVRIIYVVKPDISIYIAVCISAKISPLQRKKDVWFIEKYNEISQI